PPLRCRSLVRKKPALSVSGYARHLPLANNPQRLVLHALELLRPHLRAPVHKGCALCLIGFLEFPLAVLHAFGSRLETALLALAFIASQCALSTLASLSEHYACSRPRSIQVGILAR